MTDSDAVMQLVIVLDTSSSMDTSLSGSQEARLKAALRILSEALEKLPAALEIQVYTLGRYARIARYNSVSECRVGLQQDVMKQRSGSSKIWDTLADVLRSLPEHQGANVLCITDGEDYGSRLTLKDLQALRTRDYPQVELTVIDVTGALSASEGEAGGGTVVDVSAGVDALTSVVQDRLGVSSPRPVGLRISPPILPLYDVAPSMVAEIVGAMRKVVPYLEELTRLRYYPVPTVLVTRQQMARIRPPKSIHAAPTPRADQEELDELVNVLHNIALNFHTGRIKEYPEYYPTPLGPEVEDRVRAMAEGLGSSIEGWFRGDRKNDRYPSELIEKIRNQNPTLPVGDTLADLEALSHAIVRILRHAAELIPHRLIAGEAYSQVNLFSPQQDNSKYFALRKDDRRDREYSAYVKIRVSNPAIFQRAVPSRLHQDVQSCIGPDGQWRLDLPSVARLFEICVEVVFPLLRTAQLSVPGGPRVISQLRTAGLYIPAASLSQDRLEEVALAAGCPSAAHFANHGGVVVIDLETLLVEAEQGPLGAGQLLGSLLAHEHGHAIFEEGIGRSDDFAGLQRDDNTSQANEALAEWAELNFARADAAAFEAVTGHAAGGQFPEWPYAGALAVEKLAQVRGPEVFAGLVKQLRTDPKKASQRIARAVRSSPPQKPIAPTNW